MAKTSKRRQTSNGSAKKQLKKLLQNANSKSNPLASLPPTCLTVPINNDDNNNPSQTASIHYYKSPLPPILLKQCLDLFERNMGDMYRNSEWGLNMGEKREELEHTDARFLLILETSTTDTTNNDIEYNTSTTVHGFAHFRYEPSESTPNTPITYLYELQISQTSRGHGQSLMRLIELLSLQFQMRQIMLTVFKCNVGAMRFYLERLKYEVDESSPSNFEGGDGVEYEILSKSIGGREG